MAQPSVGPVKVPFDGCLHAETAPNVDLTSATAREYLDATVIPVLNEALSALVRERMLHVAHKLDGMEWNGGVCGLLSAER